MFCKIGCSHELNEIVVFNYWYFLLRHEANWCPIFDSSALSLFIKLSNFLMAGYFFMLRIQFIILVNYHCLIAALIKSLWWNMLSYLCLYMIKTCQIAVCNNLLWWNEPLIAFHHSYQIYYGEMIHYQWFHFTIVDYYICTAIWQVFIL